MPSSGVKPLVSVVLPVHNGEPFVSEAINSVLRQSMRDFELIAIDDGSTDHSREILEGYAGRDSRVRVVGREQQGLVATLNQGIDLAQGQWIARMDADDIAVPDRFALQLAHLTQSGADLCGGAIECFGDSTILGQYPATHAACEVQLLFGIPMAHPTVMGRQACFASLRYSSDFTHAEDYDLWQRAWATGHSFTNTSALVLKYRKHARQVSQEKYRMQCDMSDTVRRRHWQALLPDIDAPATAEILSVISKGQGYSTLLVPLFHTLIERYADEAREVLSYNFYKLFCKLAATNRMAAFDWLACWKTAKGASVNRRAAVIAMLSLCSIRNDSPLFSFMKKFYAGRHM